MQDCERKIRLGIKEYHEKPVCSTGVKIGKGCA